MATIRARAAIIQALTFSALVVLLTVLIAILARYLVTDRVDKLVQYAGHIDVNRFDAGVALEGKDEIADLFTAMQQMASRLESSMKRLTRNEERLRLIIEHAPGAIYLLNREGQLLVSNHRLHQWAGAEYPDREITTIADNLPENVVDSLAEMDKEILDGRKKTSREIYLRAPSGSDLLVEITKIPINDASGKSVGIVTLGTDITRRREIEAQLRQAQKMYAVGHLSGGIAHDFANILQGIQSHIELLRSKLKGSQQSYADLDSALEIAESGSRLIKRLLAVSRKQILEPQPIDLNETLRVTESLLQRTIGENIDVVISAEPDLWLCEADVSQVENAILNLAINARDAMPEGGTLRFETSNLQVGPIGYGSTDLKPGEYVMLSASDTGTGMSAEDCEHAFEPFFTTKGEGKGTGLGLSTIYGFAKQSGGHATLESRVGIGTTVRLYLPRTHGSIVTSPVVATQSSGEGRGETVLLVEDNPALRAVATEMLTTLGFQPFPVQDAAEALDYLQSNRPDVMLTDFMLPGGMTGPKLIKAAKLIMPNLPVMLMSGYAADGTAAKLTTRVLGPLLQKPFKMEDLNRMLRSVLDQTTDS